MFAIRCFSRNDRNDETTKTAQTATNERVDCRISGNHGNHTNKGSHENPVEKIGFPKPRFRKPDPGDPGNFQVIPPSSLSFLAFIGVCKRVVSKKGLLADVPLHPETGVGKSTWRMYLYPDKGGKGTFVKTALLQNFAFCDTSRSMVRCCTAEQ